MDNYTIKTEKPLKHVGTALFEFVFKQSFNHGKDGKIELNAIDQAGPAYFRMGFRKKGDGAILLEKELEAFQKNPAETTKIEIINSSAYAFLQEDAKAVLNRSYCSFEEAIKYGSYDKINQKFKELIKNNTRLTTEDCCRHCFSGIMYLTPDQIEKNKAKFFRFCPIGSNITFDKEDTIATLQSPILKSLVESDQLDASNALELEMKIKTNSEEFNLIISDLSLEMIKRNYISCWWIGAYLNFELTKKLISQNTFLGFKSGAIQNIQQILKNPSILDRTFY